ncbi:MAG: nitrile hydratase subunit beta [Pseudomonadota bacterium]
MNGLHDMGGMQCYGPVIPEENEPIFHADWEKKALAMTVAMGFAGKWNIDISRHARESLPPEFYLTKSYYQIWLAGLEKLMLERSMLTEQEIATGAVEIDPVAVKRVVSADEMPAALAAGGPADRTVSSDPAFAIGATVRTANLNPSGHTRLPAYARGKTGEIVHCHGAHVFPDLNATGVGENPHWLYCVAFEARELFGPDAEAGNKIMLDCWEPYLAAV